MPRYKTVRLPCSSGLCAIGDFNCDMYVGRLREKIVDGYAEKNIDSAYKQSGDGK